MARYLKKATEVDAFELFVDPMPDWFMDQVSLNNVILFDFQTRVGIKTAYGESTARKGDMIIKNSAGCIYPCRKDVFELYCEPIPETNNVQQS